MHVGSNPTARTSQSQSPRSPCRGAGRLFLYSVRRLDSFPLALHDMRFSPSHISPPIHSRYTPPHYKSLRLPYRFSRAAASEDSIRFAVPHLYSVWRDVILSPSSPRSLTDGRGDSVIAPLPAPLSVQSASRFPPRLAFRQAARCLPYYPLPYTTSGEDTCFSRTYPFSRRFRRDM